MTQTPEIGSRWLDTEEDRIVIVKELFEYKGKPLVYYCKEEDPTWNNIDDWNEGTIEYRIGDEFECSNGDVYQLCHIKKVKDNVKYLLVNKDNIGYTYCFTNEIPHKPVKPLLRHMRFRKLEKKKEIRIGSKWVDEDISLRSGIYEVKSIGKLGVTLNDDRMYHIKVFLEIFRELEEVCNV